MKNLTSLLYPRETKISQILCLILFKMVNNLRYLRDCRKLVYSLMTYKHSSLTIMNENVKRK